MGKIKTAVDIVNPFKNKLKKYIVATAGYNSYPEMKKAYQEGELSLNDIAKIGVKAAAGPIVTTYKGGKAVLDEAIKEIYSQFGEKKAMGGMMEARKKGMGLKMNTGGMVPGKFKGFSKLPEAVQQKIDPDAAEKYAQGGEVEYAGMGGMMGLGPLAIKKMQEEGVTSGGLLGLAMMSAGGPVSKVKYIAAGGEVKEHVEVQYNKGPLAY